MAQTISTSVLEFVKKIDPNRNQDFIAGQNPNLSLYKDWYKGKNAWHTRKTIKGGQVELTTIEASGTPKLIAEDWASNYANEDTVITVVDASQKEENNDNKGETTNDIINKILLKNGFFGKFNAFAEKFNALGCGAMVTMPQKLVVNEKGKLVKQANNKVKIYFLDADRVIPISIEEGEVTECAFVRVTTSKTYLQVHILVNGNYVIGEVEGANAASNTEATQFDYNNAKILRTDSDVPLFQVWHPNIGSSDNICESIYEQAIGWFKLIDTVFDCWYKEFKRGVKKRFMSVSLRQIGADGNVINTEDLLEDEDIVVPTDEGENKKQWISEFNAELRVEPIIKSLVSAMNVAARLCGLGDSSFEIGDNGGRPIQTATAAILKESKLYKNIIKQENFATTKIKALLLSIKEVYNKYISEKQLEFEEDDIQVVYDDNIMEDTDTKRKNDLAEVQAGVMSIAEYRSRWYDEDYDSALKFVQENGLLLDKYILALQSFVITPEMFVELVFGENYKYKNELIAYIKEHLLTTPMPNETGFEDENNNDEEQEEENQEDNEGGADA